MEKEMLKRSIVLLILFYSTVNATEELRSMVDAPPQNISLPQDRKYNRGGYAIDDTQKGRRYVYLHLDKERNNFLEEYYTLHNLLFKEFARYVVDHPDENASDPAVMQALNEKDLSYFLHRFFAILKEDLEEAMSSGGSSYSSEFKEVDKKIVDLQQKIAIDTQKIDLLTKQVLMLTEALNANKESKKVMETLQKSGTGR